ncbi:glycosyltransferase family A protein [Streptomyces sp. NPDC002588]|uniref:glycosyltransferase family 2 protein n=1 Tax=Streptomyces sp. NPDC002588 TaxID=3154419 RepID=UPI0033208E26
MSNPTVTVVIGAYNAMPYLTRCLESVVQQEPGAHTFECLAVDDGSTDGTGEELDRFAAAHPDLVRVVHQPNSGGPSGPRNRAIGLARGRYVFFLDADDHLGPGALRRMTDMAERNDSDVVLGKYVGVDCVVPRSMFDANQEVVDLATSRVWYALTPHKLFRRSFLLERKLRFDEDIRVGEDRLFVTKAYLQASVISVVADEDCYYKVGRDDNGNITSNYTDVMKRFEVARRIMTAIGELSEPGPVRQAALSRTFRGGLLDSFSWRFPRLTEDEQLKAMAIAKKYVDAWLTPELEAGLSAPLRVFAHCARHGLRRELVAVIDFLTAERDGHRPPHDIVVDAGRAYAAYPYFRDERAGIPDSCYDVTDDLRQDDRLDAVEWRRAGRRGVLRLRGHGLIEGVPLRDPATEVVLIARSGGREVRVPVAPAAAPGLPKGAGFTADIDITRAPYGEPLTPGVWDVYLDVRTRGLSTRRRYGARKAEGMAPAVGGGSGGLEVKPYFTAYGNLSLEITSVAEERRPRGLERRVRRRLKGLGRRVTSRRLRRMARLRSSSAASRRRGSRGPHA